MPNLDVTLDQVFISYWGSNNTSFGVANGDDYLLIPTKEFRLSTNRNSPKTVKKNLRSCLRPPLYLWKNQKPQKINFDTVAFTDVFYKEAVKDWRKRRPLVRQEHKRRIPDGWALVPVPTEGYDLVERKVDSYLLKGTMKAYEWIPKTVLKLRPTNRVWTRHSPKVPINALVNDLLYKKQTIEINSAVNKIVYHITEPDYLGDIFAYGAFDVVPWETIPLQFPLTESEDTTIVDPDTLPDLYSDIVSSCDKLALKRHYAKLKNQKVDLATELSQAMQTVNMVGEVAKRLANVLLSLKKGNLMKAFRLLFPTSRKEIANDYLMWQYGIKPLISDIQGAAEHLAEYIQRSAPVKSNGHAKRVSSDTITESLSDGTVRNTTTDYVVRVKYGTSFTVGDKLTRQAAQLGFTNPANVVWELVPFSFVVDWFLPIGDFLGNITALSGLEVKETYRTVFIEQTVLVSDSKVSGQMSSDSTEVWNGYRLSPQNHFYWTKKTSLYVKREVIPLPDIPVPRLKNPVSKVHTLNALALFSQLLK